MGTHAGCWWCRERTAFRAAEQIVLTHQAQDVLVIDLQAMGAPELSADSPIAVEAIFQRDRLDFVAQIRFRPLRRANFAKAIEAGARHAA